MKLSLNNLKLNRAIIVVLASIFFVSFTYGQDGGKRKGEHGIGLQIGGTTGNGLTYRYYGNKIGVQVSALPIFMEGNEFLMSAGLTGMYKIAESKRFDLVAYIGNHFVTRQPEKIVDEYQPGDPYYYNNSTSPFDDILLAKFLIGDSEIYHALSYNMSIGLGGILHTSNRFINFNFFTGYGVYSLNDDPLSNLALSVGITFKLN